MLIYAQKPFSAASLLLLILLFRTLLLFQLFSAVGCKKTLLALSLCAVRLPLLLCYLKNTPPDMVARISQFPPAIFLLFLKQIQQRYPAAQLVKIRGARGKKNEECIQRFSFCSLSPSYSYQTCMYI